MTLMSWFKGMAPLWVNGHFLADASFKNGILRGILAAHAVDTSAYVIVFLASAQALAAH